MLYINGKLIGGLRAKKENLTHLIVKPQVPGNTIVPPYFGGRGHVELSFDIVIQTTYEATMSTLRDLMGNGEGVYYMYDDAGSIYDNKTHAYVVINSIEGSRDTGNSLGTISMTVTLTTDHDDCSYTP